MSERVYIAKKYGGVVGGLYNVSSPDVFNGFVLFDVILAKSVQTLQLVLFMGIVLVWRNIVNSTTQFKQIDKDQNKNIIKWITSIYLTIAVLLLPTSIIANLYIPRLNFIVGIVIGIYIISLIISSVKYSFAINKILNNSNDTNKLNLIKSIQSTNSIFSFVGSVSIINIICMYIRLFINPYHKLLINWVIIHACELTCLNLFSYSVSYKARHSSHNSIKVRNQSASTIVSN